MKRLQFKEALSEAQRVGIFVPALLPRMLSASGARAVSSRKTLLRHPHSPRQPKALLSLQERASVGQLRELNVTA
jgi:hypothetical protein